MFGGQREEDILRAWPRWPDVVPRGQWRCTGDQLQWLRAPAVNLRATAATALSSTVRVTKSYTRRYSEIFFTTAEDFKPKFYTYNVHIIGKVMPYI